MDRWLTDTATSPRFPLFTRANADEVGPEPFPPLTWTLAWEQAAVPGTVDAWVNLGAFRREEFAEPVAEVYGCWGGYLYNQVSIGRVFGQRAPGANPDDIDRMYFGSNPEVPAYVPHPGDSDEECSEAVGQVLAAALSAERLPYAEDLVAESRSWRTARPDFARLKDHELVAHGRAACERLRRAWDVYIQVVINASVGPAAIHAIASGVGRPEHAVAAVTAVGDVESARMNRQVWDLSRLVRGSSELTDAFDAGTAGLLSRLAAPSASSETPEFLARIRAFLTEFGHRGPNEYDLASDTWETRPVIVLNMIDRIREQGDGQSPERRVGIGASMRDKAIAELEDLAASDAQTSATLAAAIRSSHLFYRMREACKDALVRAVHEVRLPFVELGRRAEAREDIVAAHHVFQLCEAELDAFVRDPEEWEGLLANRAAEFAKLADRVPPYTVMHGVEVPPISSWPVRGAASPTRSDVAEERGALQGVAASPGVAVGQARVVGDLSEVEELNPGEVLVCASTDPSWTPLLMAAAAVVCAVGAQGSHAAIISRELGVPCVVSVRQALHEIRTGDRLTVDGSAGTVIVNTASAP
ncbi:pyruvate, water dikinase [Haloechinothrix alba]|uniref:Pyruvate, water dikinase n=1 Tax=Haloechinothrix alba TaxID=664784 RepID=A0A239A5L2_9PSEU|nr:PEP-utilizing enzyme [Haloechinothrix alba]SNR90915.1 pyruvate, water dikinase [Haloechinothrix alba]